MRSSEVAANPRDCSPLTVKTSQFFSSPCFLVSHCSHIFPSPAVSHFQLHVFSFIFVPNAFKNIFLNRLRAPMSQRSYQGEKTAKSPCAYQTSPSTAQTWNNQHFISQRHAVGIRKHSTLKRRFTTSLHISLIYF